MRNLMLIIIFLLCVLILITAAYTVGDMWSKFANPCNGLMPFPEPQSVPGGVCLTVPFGEGFRLQFIAQ